MHWSFDQSIDQVYQSLTAAQIIARVANEGLRPPVPPRCPWNHVMQMCWHEDPAARPTFEQILLELKHVFSQQSTAPFGPQPVRYPPASYLSSSSSGGSEGREGSGLDGGGRNLPRREPSGRQASRHVGVGHPLGVGHLLLPPRPGHVHLQCHAGFRLGLQASGGEVSPWRRGRPGFLQVLLGWVECNRIPHP